MHARMVFVVAIVSVVPIAAGADESAVLQVKGRGIEGRPAYDGGGAVKFLDVSIGAQVVHLGDEAEIPLPLAVRYEVIEPAPILLTSRMGTEHWQLYSYDAETMSAMYADQKIDLAEPGEHVARAARAWFNARYGPLPGAGLVGVRGHYYLLIDRPDGRWLDVVDPPAFFESREVARKLTFTLADLSKPPALEVEAIQSTWEPGGPLRIRLAVTDARGRRFPVVNAPVAATAGGWRAELATEWGILNEPTGWMRGRLPDEVPPKVSVEAAVTLATPDGPRERRVAAVFSRGDGRVGAEEFKIAEQGYALPRNAEGALRETRAIWVSTRDFADPEGVDRVIDRCAKARLNTLVPSIFVRNTLAARSAWMPRQAEEFDPLADLIAKAHDAGLEVHPWFCVTYRDRPFREWFVERFGANVDMIDEKGEVIALGADVHRPEYRRFMVDLMVGVARDYEVDGIHLDYIRSMGRCYCAKCRSEFADRFGKPLAEATDDEWVARQREAIGDVVRRTAEGVRRARPGARMSAAVFANMSGGASQGQDPAGWARQGWIDLVLPMDYQMQTLAVRSNEREFLAALDDDDKLVTGLSLYMRSGDRVASRPAELVREQIELVRRMGIRGYCLFAFSHLSDEQLEMLREQVNAEPAVPYFRP